MVELEHSGFYPLTTEHLHQFVPANPGVYMLAIRLVSGVHKTFFTSQSDNLFSSLMKLARGHRTHVSPQAQIYMEKFQVYFTYFVIISPEQRKEVEKMLSDTADPVSKLTIINAN